MEKNISTDISEIEQKLIGLGARKAVSLLKKIDILSPEERKTLRNNIEQTIPSESDLKIAFDNKILNYSNRLYANFKRKCKYIEFLKGLDKYREPNNIQIEERLKKEQEIQSYLDIIDEKFSYDKFLSKEKFVERFSKSLLPLFEIAYDTKNGEKTEFLYPIEGSLKKTYFRGISDVRFITVKISSKDGFKYAPYIEKILLIKFLKMLKDGQIYNQ